MAKKPRKQPGYNVYAKVLGKKKKLNVQPVTKRVAMSIGSKYADRTPAASFAIKKTNRVASEVKIRGWTRLSHKFRPPYKTEGIFLPRKVYKKGNVFVEKKKFRIDSMGEILGLKKAKEAGGLRKKTKMPDLRRVL